ncbi:unnamed protein product [Rhizoctonia solani]|uniref:Transmembrane protein n=1 Tax=Rhizoctonia solani TaxID=456999 RepID=A0A8H3BDF2_9AGAM|nr:unnamed protein product [Rhizoctonia solani]
MFRVPALEYSLSHPHPRGRLFFFATLVIFLLSLPVIVIVNIVTLGSELVPSLQPNFESTDSRLDKWWDTHRLPPLLRPKPARCEPKELGRGDKFRLTPSLFDYTVMSTWNVSRPVGADGVRLQERVEYQGQPFSGCYVNDARFEYSLVEQTQTVNVGVECPGNQSADYPIYVTMQTNMVFAWELNKDFIGQYYGSILGIDSINGTSSSDYRKQVLAALQVIATDSLTIMSRDHLSNPALSMRLYFKVDPDTAEALPATEALTYTNGTYLQSFPSEAFIYVDTIYNLVNVATSAVNLDLVNKRTPNIFTNATFFKARIEPNLPPEDINSTDWAEGTRTFYYGNLTSGYQTWAQMLLDGKPVELGNPTELPEDSAMVTTYLCPAYKVKPTNSLLSSVFVGSATMTLSVWGVWMLITTFLAKRIAPPRVQCHCPACKDRNEAEAREAEARDAKKEQKEAEAARAKVEGSTTPGTLARLKALVGARGSVAPSSTPESSSGTGVTATTLTYDDEPKSERPRHSKQQSGYSDFLKGDK